MALTRLALSSETNLFHHYKLKLYLLKKISMQPQHNLHKVVPMNEFLRESKQRENPKKALSPHSATNQPQYSTRNGKSSAPSPSIRKQRKEKLESCQFCKKPFSVRRSIIAVHYQNGERPYVCGICKKSFVTWLHVKGHAKNHQINSLLKCALCRVHYTS